MSEGKRTGIQNIIFILENLAVAAAYNAGAKLGFTLAFLHSQVSPVWPPEGISLAIMLFRGYRVVPGVLLGAFSANYLNNPHIPTAALISVGNTLSVVIAHYLIRLITKSNSPFRETRHTLIFLTIGTMPGAAVSAFTGVTSLYIFGFVPEPAYWSVVLTWFTGEMQGLIIVAPFVFAWLSEKTAESRRNILALFEAAFLVLLLVAASFTAFLTKADLTYLPIPVLIIGVLRFRLRGAVTGIAIVSGIATYYTVNQTGPFAVVVDGQLSINDSLLLLELYIGVLAVMTLLLAALVQERLTAIQRQEKYADELQEQKNAFFRFVPDSFLKILGIESAQDMIIGNSCSRNMTVLFSDIRSYTSLSEKLSPEQAIEMLNDYLARMAPIIHSHNGFVDKYVGDAIMALFDDNPEDLSDPNYVNSADRAIQCSIAMRRALLELNELRKQYNQPPLETGIGISTGSVVLGTVGSMTRLDTTAIGDTVNLASRLEGLTKHLDVKILISSDTLRVTKTPADYKLRILGSVSIKGKDRPVEIHEVFNDNDSATRAAKEESGALLAQAIPLFIGREFNLAHELFQKAYEIYPDRITQRYLDRCKVYAKTRPDSDWNGSEVMYAPET